jgi:hypothetical protein
VRHRLHQFTDFRFQVFVRHDQSLHRVASVAATSGYGFVGSGFKAIGSGGLVFGLAMFSSGNRMSVNTTRMSRRASRIAMAWSALVASTTS